MGRKQRVSQEKTEGLNEALISHQAQAEQMEYSRVIEPYRRELLLHCYRLLGSLHEAEDAVQDALVRAWRHFDTFTEQGPGSLRRWLYTIATNTSLDLLKKGLPRTLPTEASAPWNPNRPLAPRSDEALWLEPFPESWLTEATENPEARYTRQESISLAFLVALQLLPARQRAILLLADVLDWRAAEIAQLLEISVGAVNSALHRARVTLEKNHLNLQRESTQEYRADAATHTLLARYLQAWETDDVDGLVALLKEDAMFSMPPVPSWYQGREAIRAILRAVLFPPGVQHRWRLLPTRANGQPAFAVYRADEATSVYRAFALQVVTLATTPHALPQIASVTAFLGEELVISFGFPPQLPL